MLEGFQAGLSWRTILLRREGFRAAFSNFDPIAVAAYGPDDVTRLMADAPHHPAPAPRSRRRSAAPAPFLAMRDRGEDLSSFVWGMAGGQAIRGRRRHPPGAKPAVSLAMSKALKARGLQIRRARHRLCLDAGGRHRR